MPEKFYIGCKVILDTNETGVIVGTAAWQADDRREGVPILQHGYVVQLHPRHQHYLGEDEGGAFISHIVVNHDAIQKDY
jgi:hypothetical protein